MGGRSSFEKTNEKSTFPKLQYKHRETRFWLDRSTAMRDIPDNNTKTTALHVQIFMSREMIFEASISTLQEKLAHLVENHDPTNHQKF